MAQRAHQGPLPNVAVAAARTVIAEKRSPHRMDDAAFLDLPRQLRTALARLIAAKPDDIVLGNSASNGLALIGFRDVVASR